MRGLFKDQCDGTLFAAEISVVQYDPDRKQLIFYSLDDDEIQIPHMKWDNAEKMVRELYSEGMMDFTRYDAFLNEDSPREDKVGKRIFGRKRKEKEPWDV